MPGDNAIQPVRWNNNTLQLLDQRILPDQINYLELNTVQAVADAIHDMVVRGAPAIGITAAYGVVIAARQRYSESSSDWKRLLEPDLELLFAARPTAVNLNWALQQMRQCLEDIETDPEHVLLAQAKRIHAEDIAANEKMGELGAALIEPDSGILTHCNAGALATGGYGTALGVVRSGWASGQINKVFADETRPWLQGARLTAWELLQDNIPVTLLVEGAVSSLLQTGQVHWFIVGSDRIAANGDVANKIGTLAGAIQARHYGVKVMVVAPTSTIDMDAPDGQAIPIESRSPDELTCIADKPVAAKGSQVWNPVFDITPASLVDVIVTEKGIVRAPDSRKMATLMQA